MKYKHEYPKYEFCKSIGCIRLKDNKCMAEDYRCIKRAKEFHTWLKNNDYKIVRDYKCKICEDRGYYYSNSESWAEAYPYPPKIDKYACFCENGVKPGDFKKEE